MLKIRVNLYKIVGLLMINIKYLARILKNTSIVQYLPLYQFNNGRSRDMKPVDINYHKNKIPRANNYNKEDAQDKKQYIQSKQQHHTNRQIGFKKNKKQKNHTQESTSNKKTSKFLGSKLSEISKVKQILQRSKTKQIIEQLKSNMHQDFAKELEDIIENGATIDVLINLFIQISFKIDLNPNSQVFNEIVKFLMNEASKKISFNQSIFQLPLYTEFILNYNKAITEIVLQKNYSFALSLNFYTYYTVYKMQNENLKKRIFRHILDEMAKIDLSEKQNFEALKQYLLRVEDQKFNEQKKLFDTILADQLMFFEAQSLKKMLITLYMSKSGFYFSNNQTTNIMEVMCLYCEDYITSSNINQIIQITLSLSKIRNKSPIISHKQLELQNLYFKNILIHSFRDQTRKLNELFRLINLFAAKVDLLENEQPQMAEIVFTYFQKQIQIVKDRSQLLVPTFSKLNETLKCIIYKNLFNYNICKKQYRTFFENMNPIVQSATRIQQIEQFIYIKNNISLLQQLEQFKKIDKAKRGNPKKIYSMLQKAIEKKDYKWMEDIMFIMLEHKGHFSHLSYLKNKDISTENTTIFNIALDLLYEKSGLKFLKKIFDRVFSSREKELNKIKTVFKTLLTWPKYQFEFIWQIFCASWLEFFVNQRKIDLGITFIEVMQWKKRRFPKQVRHLSNPLFYQILNLFKALCRKEKQISKFQLYYYRLLSEVITRQNHAVLLDSYLVPFLKDFKLENEILNEENLVLKNRLQLHIMLYKLKGLVSEEQIALIYEKAIVQGDRIFTEREKMLISSTYSFYKKHTTEPLSIKERILQLIAINDSTKQKQLQVELSQSNTLSVIKNAILNFTAKQLISLLLSPLFEVNLLKCSWQILLAKGDLQYHYLDWKTLLEKYYFNEAFALQAANLTKKIIEYYSKHLNLLILQDLQIIYNVCKYSKIKINTNKMDTFLRDALKNLVQKNLEQQSLDQILACIYQTKVQLNQQLATNILQLKFKKKGACIYLFLFEQNLRKQDYGKFLRNYFMYKLTTNIPLLPFQVELHFKKSYPSSIQPYLTKISHLSSTKRDVFVGQDNIRSQLKHIERNYENIEVNFTYNFIITGDQLLLFTNKQFQNIYPNIFRKISELIPQALNKSVTTIVVDETGFDVKALEKKYSWAKKSIKAIANEQPQPEIKDLELQMKLAQNIAELQLEKERSQMTQIKTSQNLKTEERLI